MKVLVACEFSGIVRDAFSANGHDAWSCDILPSDRGGQHIQDDVLRHLDGWDLIVGHPPCTYLSVAGNAWLKRPGRTEKRQMAFDFFMAIYNAPCSKVCVENPIGYVGTAFRKPDQIINPFMFGSPERKRTGLWLRGLKKLADTIICFPAHARSFDATTGKARYFTESQTPSAERWKIRATTFQGIADAMADQWGPIETALA